MYVCDRDIDARQTLRERGDRDRAVLAVTGQPVQVDVGVCAVLRFTFGPGLPDLT